MIKNSEKFGLILLLCLSLTNFTGRPAFADNTLSQVDIRRNSSDGLEFTLYTSSPYADNVVVTKKSDNKYVILMPNVNSASGGKPDFSSVKDMVSDVDVRAVNDGTGGYTKVTVITNRPVDIKTNTAKSMPVTEGEREYRALIAQKRTAVPQHAVSQPASTATAKQSAGFKLPEIQPTKTAADIVSTAVAAAKPQTKTQPKEQVKQQTTQKAVSKPEAKPAVDKKQVSTKVANAQPAKDSNIKPVSAQKTETTPKPAEPAKTAPITTAKPNNNIDNTVSAQPAAQTEQIQPETTSSETETKTITQDSQTVSALMHKITNKLPKNLPVTLTLIFVPLICLMALFNLIRNSLLRSQALKASFLQNIANGKKPVQNYDNIINNENLSWQEKYQQYMDISGEKAEAEEANQEKYTFITKTKQAKQQPAPELDTPTQQPAAVNKAQNKPTPRAAESKYVKESRLERLERMLHASPNKEKTQIENDIIETEKLAPADLSTDTILAADNTSVSEDNTIHENMKSFKFKAFEEKVSLEETHRNKKIKHRRVQIELPKEGPHVNLGYSQLHTNPRLFKNANLSVSDLIATGNKLLNIKPEFKEDKNDYDVISVDEYFNIIDDDKSKVTSSLSDVVANSLANMKQNTVQTSKPNNKVTNPITKTKNETKEDYLSGLIVKSGFNIDANRGFYLVSLDGKSAIVGRIGEDVFVLKKFDRNINQPLQVRMDNPNVYMVKADDFKSLVEVSKDNMGVLIEL